MAPWPAQSPGVGGETGVCTYRLADLRADAHTSCSEAHRHTVVQTGRHRTWLAWSPRIATNMAPFPLRLWEHSRCTGTGGELPGCRHGVE